MPCESWPRRAWIFPASGRNGLDELRGVEFDYVVTVCDNAHESCPVFPGKAKVIHVGFDDPPRLAADAKTEEERLAPYRRVRDEIRAFVETLPASLNQYHTTIGVSDEQSGRLQVADCPSSIAI